MAEDKKTIEEQLEEVDSIIEKLENGEVSLEDSFKIYEKGMKLVASVNSRIDKVEKKLIEIQAAGLPDEEV